MKKIIPVLMTCCLFGISLFTSCTHKETSITDPILIFYSTYEDVTFNKNYRIMQDTGTLVIDSTLIRDLQVETNHDSIHVVCEQEGFNYWYKPYDTVDGKYIFLSNNQEPPNTVSNGILTINPDANTIEFNYTRGGHHTLISWHALFSK